MNRKREGSAGKGAKTDQQSNPEPFMYICGAMNPGPDTKLLTQLNVNFFYCGIILKYMINDSLV